MAMLVKPIDSEGPGKIASAPFSLKKKPALSLVSKTEDELFRERLIARLESDLNPLVPPRVSTAIQPVVPPKPYKALAQTECIELRAWLASSNFENMKPMMCILDVEGCAEIYRKRHVGSQCERVAHSKPTVPSRPPDWCDHVVAYTKAGWDRSRPPTALTLIQEARKIGKRIDEDAERGAKLTGFARLSYIEKSLLMAANQPKYQETPVNSRVPDSAPDSRESAKLRAWLYEHCEDYKLTPTQGLAKFFHDLKVPPNTPEAFEDKGSQQLSVRLEWMEMKEPSVPREEYSTSKGKVFTSKEKYNMASLAAKRYKEGKISKEKYLSTLEYLGVTKSLSTKKSVYEDLYMHGPVKQGEVIAVGEPTVVHQHTFDDVREEVNKAYEAKSASLREENVNNPSLMSGFAKSVIDRLSLVEEIERCINNGVKSLVYPLTQYTTRLVEDNVNKKLQEMGKVESIFIEIPDQAKGYKPLRSGILVPDYG